MGFLQRGQGPLGWLSVPCALLLAVVFVLSGCAHKGGTQGSSITTEASSQPAFCPPVANQNPVPAPNREDDFTMVFDHEGALSGDASVDMSYEDAAGSEDSLEDSSDESLEEVREVPSISDIVLAQYEDWRGVRYRSGGTDYRGVDCSGLVQAIYRDAFEVDLPRASSDQARLGESVPKGDIRPGDLLYFVDRGRKHVGVAVNDREFVHASRRKGVIISKFEGYWSKRLIRVRRILDEKEQDVQTRTGG